MQATEGRNCLLDDDLARAAHGIPFPVQALELFESLSCLWGQVDPDVIRI